MNLKEQKIKASSKKLVGCILGTPSWFLNSLGTAIFTNFKNILWSEVYLDKTRISLDLRCIYLCSPSALLLLKIHKTYVCVCVYIYTRYIYIWYIHTYIYIHIIHTQNPSKSYEKPPKVHPNKHEQYGHYLLWNTFQKWRYYKSHTFIIFRMRLWYYLACLATLLVPQIPKSQTFLLVQRDNECILRCVFKGKIERYW